MNERIETIGVLLGDYLVDVAVRIWEPNDSKSAVICIHGFASTSQNFAPLAETLIKSGITVIAPDMFGRGQSTFFGRPEAYNLQNQMIAIAVTKRYQKEKTCHLGSSWGALLMLLHVATQNWMTSGLILNDCPISNDANTNRIGKFLTAEATRIFSTWNEAEEYVLKSRRMHFLTGSWKNRYVASMLRKVDDGWRMNYDPSVIGNLVEKEYSCERLLKEAPKPVLLNFGSDSCYANDPRLIKITRKNPNITFLNSMTEAHPPSLMKPDQILTIAGYLGQCMG